jgi:hypothetical protein
MVSEANLRTLDLLIHVFCLYEITEGLQINVIELIFFIHS